MPRGYKANQEDLDRLADDGASEWVLEELAEGLNQHVYFKYFEMESSRSRAMQAHIAAVLSIVINAVEAMEIAPFYGSIVDALNEAEIPKFAGKLPWSRTDIAKLMDRHGVRKAILAVRTPENPAYIEYVRENPQVTNWELF